MKIVYISKYTILPQYGNPTRQYFLSKFLSQRFGHNVLLISSRSTMVPIPAFKGLTSEFEQGNLKTVVLNGPLIKGGFNIRRLWSWILFEIQLFRFKGKIKSYRPDIVIVSSLSILTFLYGVFLKRWLKIPLVLEIRDLYPLTLLEVGGFSKKNPLVRILSQIEKFGYYNAELILSTLPNAKEHIEKVIKRQFNFKWLPMGVDIDYFKNETKVRRPFDCFIKKKEKEFLIGYAGTLGKSNALDVIFQTATLLEKSYPQIKFIFIGQGPLKLFFQEKYKNLENIKFKDRVPKIELQLILSEMDVLINTWLDRPLYRYGISPNKWIDYMMAEKPLLVSFSGFDTIIKEADCGFVVPAEDKNALAKKIIFLSGMEKKELKRMGENGKKYLLANLTYEKLSEELNNSLIEIINKKRKICVQ